jgi:hypothetical protein
LLVWLDASVPDRRAAEDVAAGSSPVRGTGRSYAVAMARRAQPVELPGEELVSQGIRDLERGLESPESLLVSIGAPRLRRLGLTLPQPFASPEHRLYQLLRTEHGDAAHSRYNALVRRLVSYERSAGIARAGRA